MKTKEKIVNLVSKFENGEIIGHREFWESTRKWSIADENIFWTLAMNTAKVKPAIDFAYRLLDYLKDNDLIDFMCIADGFISLNEDDSCANVGLLTYTVGDIQEQSEYWLSENEDDEAIKLQAELASMKGEWYWVHIYDYCIWERNDEEDFVSQVAQSLRG